MHTVYCFILPITIYSAFYLALGISCYSNILPSVLPFPNDMPSTWPYFRFRLILVVYSLYTFVCSVPSNIARFAFPTLSLVSPFLYFPLFYLPILTPCFSLFTLSLFGPPFTDLSILPPVSPSHQWTFFIATCLVLPSLTVPLFLPSYADHLFFSLYTASCLALPILIPCLALPILTPCLALPILTSLYCHSWFPFCPWHGYTMTLSPPE